jgi:hypothetical protein
MGLATSVFYLAAANGSGDPEWAANARQQFQALAGYLEKTKIPHRPEPETYPSNWKPRPYVSSYSYEYLQHLRRFYANVQRFRQAPRLYPLKPRRTDEEIATAEEWIADTLEYDFSSNLLCHSTVNGCFVPLPHASPMATGPLFGNDLLGSSNGLRAELVLLAPYLKIKLVRGRLTNAEHASVWKACHSSKERYLFEKTTWLTLFETATASIKYGTAIVFH